MYYCGAYATTIRQRDNVQTHDSTWHVEENKVHEKNGFTMT